MILAPLGVIAGVLLLLEKKKRKPFRKKWNLHDSITVIR